MEEATLKGHYALRFNSMHIEYSVNYGPELTLPKYMKGHQWNPVPSHLG